MDLWMGKGLKKVGQRNQLIYRESAQIIQL